ncbi:hypothetical protein KQI61_15485 [Anaerocolumna aminovalerica]|uniref:hypothetical protein n=1 Tax=Anaerocolumna aminovalerica TaxID=1527 RepID=UPI001C0EEC5D|nr:hypothetical protein [Anaerocolumna aminovalerica]MBU5333601.1 hypothetical protein [Anaerocolumna aminovalerica]
MDNLGYKNRLEVLGVAWDSLQDYLKKYKDDQMMYVYISTYPDDKILTGQYLRNYGVIEGTKFIPEEQTMWWGDNELCIIKHMTLKEYKSFVEEKKKEIEELDNKYPYLVNGGKYGWVWFNHQIKDKSYLKDLPPID